MKKLYKIGGLLLLVIFVLTGCFNRPGVYHNKAYRYKINYPDGWIMLSSKIKNEKYKEFEQEVIAEEWITDFDAEDACFYNPKSSAPIFESIKIHSKESKLSIKNLRSNISQIGQMLTMQMVKKYEDVRNYYAEVIKFRQGEAIRFDFSFTYKGQEYNGIFLVIPGRIYATYFISGICKMEDKYRFSKTFDEVVNSFSKY